MSTDQPTPPNPRLTNVQYRSASRRTVKTLATVTLAPFVLATSTLTPAATAHDGNNAHSALHSSDKTTTTKAYKHNADGSIETIYGTVAKANPQDAPPTLSANDATYLDSAKSSSGAKQSRLVTMDEQLSAAAPVTRDITIALAVPPGFEPDSVTADTVAKAIRNVAAPYWETQTAGTVQYRVATTHSWYRTTADCSDPFMMWRQIASAVKWQNSPTNHLFLYLPASARSACGAGLGTVGQSEHGALAYTTGPLRPDIITHELGHNLGLGHANSVACPTKDDSSFTASSRGRCKYEEYGDYTDIMGASHGEIASLSAANEHVLGLNDAPAITTPTTLRLYARHLSEGRRSATVKAPNGKLYFVEYRPTQGANSWMRDWGLAGGVQVRRQDPQEPSDTIVIDATPTLGSGDHSTAIPGGSTLPIAGGAVTVTASDYTVDYAKVTINFPQLGTKGSQPLSATTATQNAPSGPRKQAVNLAVSGS